MELRSPASGRLLPIPLSVLLTLLWVGLIHLFFLLVTVGAGTDRDGEIWTAVLFGERVLGRARLPTIIVGISLLLLVYLWLDYRSQISHSRRSRASHGWRTLVFLVAAALLVYLGWAVWYAWWRGLDVLTEPVDMLMTGLPNAAVLLGVG